MGSARIFIHCSLVHITPLSPCFDYLIQLVFTLYMDLGQAVHENTGLGVLPNLKALALAPIKRALRPSLSYWRVTL